jgi:hypothetical protein
MGTRKRISAIQGGGPDEHYTKVMLYNNKFISEIQNWKIESLAIDKFQLGTAYSKYFNMSWALININTIINAVKAITKKPELNTGDWKDVQIVALQYNDAMLNLESRLEASKKETPELIPKLPRMKKALIDTKILFYKKIFSMYNKELTNGETWKEIIDATVFYQQLITPLECDIVAFYGDDIKSQQDNIGKVANIKDAFMEIIVLKFKRAVTKENVNTYMEYNMNTFLDDIYYLFRYSDRYTPVQYLAKAGPDFGISMLLYLLSLGADLSLSANTRGCLLRYCTTLSKLSQKVHITQRANFFYEETDSGTVKRWRGEHSVVTVIKSMQIYDALLKIHKGEFKKIEAIDPVELAYEPEQYVRSYNIIYSKLDLEQLNKSLDRFKFSKKHTSASYQCYPPLLYSLRRTVPNKWTPGCGIPGMGKTARYLRLNLPSRGVKKGSVAALGVSLLVVGSVVTVGVFPVVLGLGLASVGLGAFMGTIMGGTVLGAASLGAAGFIRGKLIDHDAALKSAALSPIIVATINNGKTTSAPGVPGIVNNMANSPENRALVAQSEAAAASAAATEPKGEGDNDDLGPPPSNGGVYSRRRRTYRR